MGARPLQHTLWALVYLAVLVAVPTAAALCRVYVRQDCLALGYRLSVEQQRRDALRAQVRKAELTRARGRTPAALMAMAERLQLVPPRPSQTLGPTGPAALKSVPEPKLQVQPAPPPKAKVPPHRAQPH